MNYKKLIKTEEVCVDGRKYRRTVWIDNCDICGGKGTDSLGDVCLICGGEGWLKKTIYESSDPAIIPGW